MRVVLDTNVLVAAIVARGTCHEVWERCVSAHELFSSLALRDELVSALRRQIALPSAQVHEARALLSAHAEFVAPLSLPEDSCRDPDDVLVLGTALAASAECIVTGDKDLLILGEFRGIRILSPREFWAFEASR